MTDQNTQNLAEQIARILEKNQNGGDDLLRSTLENINARLENLESQRAIANRKSNIANPKSFHPSLEKFTDLEELADEIINGLKDEKACPFEPTAKPCDNCSMCNSRGF